MPPLTTENSSALCGGVQSRENDMRAKQPGAQPETVKVKVLRDFQNHRREILKKGDSEATLPRLFAIEMQAANKVKILQTEPEPVKAPEPVKDPTPDKPKQGRKEKQS